MLRMPTGHLTKTARANLDRFRGTAAAREIEDDPKQWTVVAWSWAATPPLRVHLRDDAGDVVDFAMDAFGVWQLSRQPLQRRFHIVADLER